MSINQAFEEYGKGCKAFAEDEHKIFRHIHYEYIPMYAELFEAGRREGKSDKEIEDNILEIQKESDKDINDEAKAGSDRYKECIKCMLEVWKALTEEAIKAAKKLAHRITHVEKEFKKFAKLEKEGKHLVTNSADVGFRHDRFIMAVEDVHSFEDIKEEGLMHTFKDKKNLLWDVYFTTEEYAYIKVFDMNVNDAEAQEEIKINLPPIDKYVPGKDEGNDYVYARKDNGQELKLIDAETDYKTNYYANFGLYILEPEDAQTHRILGVREKPDDPKIIDYQVLYESPECIKQKKKYSSGEWIIEKAS